jgi:hypothetical protein
MSSVRATRRWPWPTGPKSVVMTTRYPLDHGAEYAWGPLAMEALGAEAHYHGPPRVPARAGIFWRHLPESAFDAICRAWSVIGLMRQLRVVANRP